VKELERRMEPDYVPEDAEPKEKKAEVDEASRLRVQTWLAAKVGQQAYPDTNPLVNSKIREELRHVSTDDLQKLSLAVAAELIREDQDNKLRPLIFNLHRQLATELADREKPDYVPAAAAAVGSNQAEQGARLKQLVDDMHASLSHTMKALEAQAQHQLKKNTDLGTLSDAELAQVSRAASMELLRINSEIAKRAAALGHL